MALILCRAHTCTMANSHPARTWCNPDYRPHVHLKPPATTALLGGGGLELCSSAANVGRATSAQAGANLATLSGILSQCPSCLWWAHRIEISSAIARMNLAHQCSHQLEDSVNDLGPLSRSIFSERIQGHLYFCLCNLVSSCLAINRIEVDKTHLHSRYASKWGLLM